MEKITRKNVTDLINYFNGYGSPFDALIINLASHYLRKGWIDLKLEKPKNGQEVLVYWYEEEYEVEQIHILSYFEEGSAVEDPTVEVILTGRGTKVYANRGGFYIYENGKWRKHADLITHWQPLPTEPILPDYDY